MFHHLSTIPCRHKVFAFASGSIRYREKSMNESISQLLNAFIWRKPHMPLLILQLRGLVEGPLGESFKSYNNNSNISFMAPHLIRGWSSCKDIQICSFYLTHTHARTHARTHAHTHTNTHTTNTCINSDWLVE